MSYGTNGSVIGPDNVPTTSVASGVWSLGEMSEAQRDGIWPNPEFSFEKIATITPGTGAASVTFSSIPATYKHLECLVFSAIGAYTSAAIVNNMTNDISGSSGYATLMQMQSGNVGSMAQSYSLYSAGYGAVGSTGDNTHGSIIHFLHTNYANATGSWMRAGDGKPVMFEGAAWHTTGGGTSQGYSQLGGAEKIGNNDGALTSITVNTGGYYTADASYVLYGLRAA